MLLEGGAEPLPDKSDLGKKGKKGKKAPQGKAKTSQDRQPEDMKPAERQYVLTVLKDGQWHKLTDPAEIQALETECPEAAELFRNPEKLREIKVPEFPPGAEIFDAWQDVAAEIVKKIWKTPQAWLF